MATVVISSNGRDVDATRFVAVVAVVAALTSGMYWVMKLEATIRGKMTGEWQFTSWFDSLETAFCSNSFISTLIDLYAQKSGGYCDRNHTRAARITPCTMAHFQPFFSFLPPPER